MSIKSIYKVILFSNFPSLKYILVYILFNIGGFTAWGQNITANNPGSDIIFYQFLRSPDGANHNLHIDASNGNDLYFNHYMGGHIRFGFNGQRMIVTEAGNVGINQINPAYKLDLRSADATHALFKGTYEGIQGIQVERESGANVRLVASDNNYGGGLISSSALQFAVSGNNANTPAMFINTLGQVGIGVDPSGLAPDEDIFGNSEYLLSVNGKVAAEELRVELSADWPDYVFKSEYQLPSLEQVEMHIKAKGHLPNVPSAAEVQANGIEVGNMQRVLMEKIEELTLYLIEQQKEIKQLELKNQTLLERIESLDR